MRVLAASLILLANLGAQDPTGPVRLVRVPGHGLQPRAVVDDAGTIYLVYFVGAAQGGDLRYTTSTDGRAFAPPLPVNSLGSSAIAAGNVRGAQIALGRGNRLHVVWNGRGAGKAPAPLLYTRLDADTKAFAPERDVIEEHHGLDGGSAVAADASGRVTIVWQAPATGAAGEGSRRVWQRVSTDDGATFGAEQDVSPADAGVCPCCGMAAIAAAEGGLAILYRMAKDGSERDTVWLGRGKAEAALRSQRLDPWNVSTCVMSTFALARRGDDVLGAWETEGQVRFAFLGAAPAVHAAPGPAGKRKHPSLAVNTRGEVLLAWTEGMAWAKSGALAWQVFDPQGEPVPGASGRQDGVPAWSLVQALALADGTFVILY